MPIYEYSCRGCGHEFEALVSGHRRTGPSACHAADLARVFSLPAIASDTTRAIIRGDVAARSRAGRRSGARTTDVREEPRLTRLGAAGQPSTGRAARLAPSIFLSCSGHFDAWPDARVPMPAMPAKPGEPQSVEARAQDTRTGSALGANTGRACTGSRSSSASSTQVGASTPRDGKTHVRVGATAPSGCENTRQGRRDHPLVMHGPGRRGTVRDRCSTVRDEGSRCHPLGMHGLGRGKHVSPPRDVRFGARDVGVTPTGLTNRQMPGAVRAR